MFAPISWKTQWGVHIIHLTWSKFKLNDNLTENGHSALIFLEKHLGKKKKKNTAIFVTSNSSAWKLQEH